MLIRFLSDCAERFESDRDFACDSWYKELKKMENLQLDEMTDMHGVKFGMRLIPVGKEWMRPLQRKRTEVIREKIWIKPETLLELILI